jgi:hypothetical protein
MTFEKRFVFTLLLVAFVVLFAVVAQADEPVKVTKAQLITLIGSELGVVYLPEDNYYIAPLEREFGKTLKQSIFGMKERYYQEEGNDCDNRSLELRWMLKKRFYNRYIKKYASLNGTSHHPDVFVEEIKVRFAGQPTPHWLVVCLASDEAGNVKLIYRELTKNNIVEPSKYWRLIKIK